MDHMRISGTGPSLVILSQTKKLTNGTKLMPQKYKPTEFQFQSILNTENSDVLQTLQINRSRLKNSGTHWSTSSDTHQVVEIQKETPTQTTLN